MEGSLVAALGRIGPNAEYWLSVANAIKLLMSAINREQQERKRNGDAQERPLLLSILPNHTLLLLTMAM